MDNMEQREAANGHAYDEPENCRTHRVGTVTCGLVLILYGILFLVRLALPALDYRIIMELWPIVLVMLGVEILISSVGKNQDKQKFVYDFPAVLIIIVMLLFTMIMAVADFCMAESLQYHL
ncbi:MAG: hypothetical protein K2H31_06510 [Lachnospiraceae bacterium]|nr:hypothetical protein [Lachnospiraceae bacterium]